MTEVFIIYDCNEKLFVCDTNKYKRCKFERDAQYFWHKEQAYQHINFHLPTGVYRIYPIYIKKDDNRKT